MGPDRIYKDQQIKELGLSRAETQCNSAVSLDRLLGKDWNTKLFNIL